MAGVAGHNFRLIVGANEFSGLLSEMSADYAVNELDDSVSLSANMEYIPGQRSSTLTAGGRWTGNANEIDDAITRTLSESDFIAGSMDGLNYDTGTIIKTSKSVSASLGSRVNVNLGFRLSSTDRGMAKEIFRSSFPSTTGATTTLTGDVVDLGAAASSASRSLYVYYFAGEGNVPAISVDVQDSSTSDGTFTTANSFNLTSAAISTAIAARMPVINTSTYDLDRYVQVEVDITGVGRSGEIAILQSV